MEDTIRIKLFKIVNKQEIFIVEGYIQKEKCPPQVGDHMLILKTDNNNKFLQTSKINKIDGTTLKTNNSTYKYYICS